MHSHSVATFEHAHNYLGEKHDRHERRTWFVVILTAAMMVAEIIVEVRRCAGVHEAV
jgi:Co/Zn/Cd efflux system component